MSNPQNPWQPPHGPPGYYDPGYQQGGMPVHGAPGPMVTRNNPYDPEVMYKNPTGGWPGPLAVENRGHWVFPKLQWQFAAVAGQEYRAQLGWGTPLFDLRPDLRGSAGVEPTGQGIFRGGAFGAGARLHVKFTGINNLPAGSTLRLYYVTYGDPVNPGDTVDVIDTLCKPQEFTEQFYNGANSVVMTWTPDGGPMRYWRLEIFARQYGGAVDGNIFITASLT